MELELGLGLTILAFVFPKWEDNLEALKEDPTCS